jgi:PKHD-type hydroxylase
MILAIADVLSPTDLAEVVDGLASATFVDGRSTAGWAARLVKANLQADAGPELDHVSSRAMSRATNTARTSTTR